VVEALSNLHLELFKQAITAEDAEIMHERLEACPVKREDPPELGRRAWELAERFGWAALTTQNTSRSPRSLIVAS
jgi:hypothetical protein